MSEKTSGRLFLLPAPLQPYGPEAWTRTELSMSIPAKALWLLENLSSFIVESERSAMRLLSRLKDREKLSEVSLRILDEHSLEADIPLLLEDVEAGKDCGFFTEAGTPCVADPGAALVAFAHSRGIRVVPVSGPSSIMLALSSSGLDAQRFAFLGYLPQDRGARRAALQRLGREYRQDGMTRIFIETPYRNDAFLADCIATLPENSFLAVAAGLCGAEERIVSRPLADWKKAATAPLGKVPAVFLFGSRASLKPRNTA